MLQAAFLSVAGYSLQAAVVILVVILMRFVLRKLGAPAVVSYALWAVVLFRLLCPVSLESPVGVVPAGMADLPARYAIEFSGDVALDSGPVMSDDLPEDSADWTYFEYDVPKESVRREILLSAPGVLWSVGVAALVIYSVIAYLRLRRKLVGAVELDGNIHLADHISSPFVMGLFRPRIYLPSNLPETEREYIILHEKTHIRRLDHIVKILAFVALCIHWFNPLVWLAFYLSGQDMEMSCDEAVLKRLGGDIRADYSASLLKLSTGRTVIAATPLAFGEGNTKGRIQNLAKWKKPAVWITVVAVLLCAAVIVLCATNAKPVADNTDIPQQTGQPEPPPRKYGPDQIYVSERCLYMNSLSSYAAMGGDSGYYYRMGDSGVYKVSRSNGSAIQLASGADWERWSNFPWTEKEWEELFWPEGLWVVDISGYSERKYCPLSEETCLLRMDGELWLVELSLDKRIGTHIWDMYLLVPESSKGHAQWEYAPMLSSRMPYFRIEFDMEYDTISAVCTERNLADMDGFVHPTGEPGIHSPEADHAMEFSEGHAVYWFPWDANRIAAEKAEITFGVQKDGETVCMGTVYLQGSHVAETGRTIYTATVVGTGLVIEQNPETEGAIIRLK